MPSDPVHHQGLDRAFVLCTQKYEPLNLSIGLTVHRRRSSSGPVVPTDGSDITAEMDIHARSRCAVDAAPSQWLHRSAASLKTAQRQFSLLQSRREQLFTRRIRRSNRALRACLSCCNARHVMQIYYLQRYAGGNISRIPYQKPGPPNHMILRVSYRSQ